MSARPASTNCISRRAPGVPKIATALARFVVVVRPPLQVAKDQLPVVAALQGVRHESGPPGGDLQPLPAGVKELLPILRCGIPDTDDDSEQIGFGPCRSVVTNAGTKP